LALIGYARVSSVGQSLDVQLDKLQHCHKIFQEKASGASGQRPRLHACLEYVREGDTLVVTRLDRLARSTLQLCRVADELQRKQVHLQVLDQHLDTSDATGRLLFNMLGAIAQFETGDTHGAADGWDSESERAGYPMWTEKDLNHHANGGTAAQASARRPYQNPDA
jgi:DNA invertase Pin-like site-specific DNA recombinase